MHLHSIVVFKLHELHDKIGAYCIAFIFWNCFATGVFLYIFVVIISCGYIRLTTICVYPSAKNVVVYSTLYYFYDMDYALYCCLSWFLCAFGIWYGMLCGCVYRLNKMFMYWVHFGILACTWIYLRYFMFFLYIWGIDRQLVGWTDG